jgi:hypothetical protein
VRRILCSPSRRKDSEERFREIRQRIDLMVESVVSIGADFLKSYLLDGLTAVGSQRSV